VPYPKRNALSARPVKHNGKIFDANNLQLLIHQKVFYFSFRRASGLSNVVFHILYKVMHHQDLSKEIFLHQELILYLFSFYPHKCLEF
jgi:hypothetical protein